MSDATHSLRSLYFFSLLLFTSIYPFVKKEQLWESASLHQKPKTVSPLLSLMAEQSLSSFSINAIPHTFVPMISAYVGFPICLIIPLMCLLLAISL